MRKSAFSRKDTAERCVLCGEKTEYSKQTPVSNRDAYIDGAGQLCTACFASLYLKGRAGDD